MGAIETAIRLNDQVSRPLALIQNNLKQVNQTMVNLKQVNQKVYNLTQLSHVNNTYQQINQSLQQNYYLIQQNRSEQERHTREVKNTSRASSGLLDKVKQLAAAYLGMRAVSGFLKLADDMTLVESRIGQINDGKRKDAELSAMIYESASRARSSYTEMLDSVTKLNLLAKDAFQTNEEAVAFTEQMNKQFKIGGAPLESQKAAMQQLTQALASGVLQGDEFRSVMENAPMLAQAIARHLGVSSGELKKLSSEGKITADVIKNSVFASAAETDAAFKSLPLTLADVGTQIQNDFVKRLRPAIAAFHQLVNNESFQNFVRRISAGAAVAAGGIEILIHGISMVTDFLDRNWDIAGPILGGAAAAILAVTIAQAGLNAVMAVNPVLLIIMAVGALLGYLWSLVESVGGVKIAFLLFQMAVFFVWDMIKITTMQGVFKVQEFLEKMKLGFLILKNGILNGMGSFKAGFLMLLQSTVNGGIDILNGFFQVLNKVPGVSIGMVDHVSFGAAAAAEEEALRQAREKEVREKSIELGQFMEKNAETIEKMKEDAVSLLHQRQTEIAAQQEAVKAEKAEKEKALMAQKEGNDFSKLYSEAKNTNANLKGIGKDVKATKENGLKVENEDLSYLKAILLRRTLQQVHLDNVNIQVDNRFGDIHETADLNGWIGNLTEELQVAMQRLPEGGLEL